MNSVKTRPEERDKEVLSAARGNILTNDIRACGFEVNNYHVLPNLGLNKHFRGKNLHNLCINKDTTTFVGIFCWQYKHKNVWDFELFRKEYFPMIRIRTRDRVCLPGLMTARIQD